MATKSNPAMIEPELKGSPIEFTKKISKTLNNLRRFGANNLKINNNMATDTTLAMMKFLMVISL